MLFAYLDNCVLFSLGIMNRLRMVTQSGSHQELLPAVNRLEEVLKTKYSTTSLQYSSVGHSLIL